MCVKEVTNFWILDQAKWYILVSRARWRPIPWYGNRLDSSAMLISTDGLRGPIIVSDFYAPFKFDKQYTMTLSDHYHQEAPALVNYYQSPDNYNNYGGTEPVPDSTLINEQQGARFSVEAGKTYLFNIISMAAFAAHWVQFNQHTMTVVEVDGVYTVPFETQQLYVTTAQRYTVLLTANANPSINYGIVSQMNTQMFDPMKMPQDGSYISFVCAPVLAV